MLEPISAVDKHIFFVADFCEGGFVLVSGDYSNVVGDMTALAGRLADNGIKVHLLFLREPVVNHEFVPLWDNLAAKTGGELISVGDPSALPQTVESCYFGAFAYSRSVTTGINTSDIAQDIPIRLPAFELYRARIYATSDAPLRGMQARADGVELSFSETRSYFMIELKPPLPEMVTLSLPPGENADVRVYLLADSRIALTAQADNIAEENAEATEYRQKTAVTLTPLSDNLPLFAGSLPPDVTWSLTATASDGQTAGIDSADYVDGSFICDFYPESFGLYTFSLSLESQGIRISAEAPVEIREIELPDADSLLPKYDYSLWIAIAVGALVILTAILIAGRRRKNEAKGAPIPATLNFPSSALKPASNIEFSPAGVFAGKLDIYGILVEGGKAEIPAMSIRLDTLAKNGQVTLSTILKQAGVPYHYPAAAHINLLAGSNYTLIVKNSSDAVIFCGGQPRNRGQQAVLTFGQKMRVIFENDVSEYDIFYHNTAQMAISGDHIHVEARQ
jgi:hypothetical protein